MSDISSFAEWEAHNRVLAQEQISQEEQRLRKLRDHALDMSEMAVDSSNDGRSDIVDESGDEGVKDRDVVMREEDIETEDEDEGGAELELVSGTMLRAGWRFGGEIASSTAPTQSQSQNMHPDYVAPPSSQPRDMSSSPILEDERIDAVSTTARGLDFSLDSQSPYPSDDNNEMSQAEGYEQPDLQVQQSKYRTYFETTYRPTVEHYAKTHPFYTDYDLVGLTLTGDTMAEYKEDVYRFARASGMGKQSAKVEVMRAKAAWEKHTGLGDGLILDLEDESDFEATRVPRLRSAATYYPETPVVNAAVSEVVVASEVVADTAARSKKRKRNEIEPATNTVLLAGKNKKTEEAKEQVRLEKRARQKEKKARQKKRKALRLENKNSKKEQKLVDIGAKKAHISEQVSNSDLTEDEPARTQPTFHEVPIPAASFTPAAVTPATKKQRRSKHSPTTSAYFPKPPAPVTDEESGRKNSDSKVPHLSNKQKRHARHEAEALALKNSESAVTVSHEIEDGEAAKEQVAEPVSQSSDGNAKRKRKRDRNHNKLPDSSAEPGVASKKVPPPPQVPALVKDQVEREETARLRAEKKLRTESFLESVQTTDASSSERAKRREELLRRENASGPEGGESDGPAEIIEQPRSSFSPTHMRQRRDRGRKGSKLSQPSVSVEPQEEEEPIKALTELDNTNSTSPKLQRRDRGRRGIKRGETDRSVSENQGLKENHS